MTQANILKTKLFIPPFKNDMIRRPYLVERINSGMDRKVVLVSAPAGFGKSTLLAEWAVQNEVPVAWVSLDKSENDARTFLSYLIASVQQIYPGLGDASLSALNMPGTPAVAPLLHAWINDISTHAQPFALILDDFHQISDKEVIDIICELIDNQPSQLHLVLVTRESPLSLIHIENMGRVTRAGAVVLPPVLTMYTRPETIEEVIDQVTGKILDALSIDGEVRRRWQ